MVTFCGWGWRKKQEDILQKHSSGCVLQERCSQIFGKAYWKTSVQGLFFKKKKKKRNLGCKPAALSKKKLMHKFFSVNFLNFFRTAFL